MAGFSNILGEDQKTSQTTEQDSGSVEISNNIPFDVTIFSNVINELKNNPNPQIKELGDRLSILKYDTLNTDAQRQIEGIFRMIRNINPNKYGEQIISLKVYVKQIEDTYNSFSSQRNYVIGESRTRAIFVTGDISDEIDWGTEPWYGLNPWSARIIDNYEEAERLWENHDKEGAERRISSLITSLKLNRSTLDIETMDSYIEDLRSNNSLNAEQRDELERQITIFKKGELYKSLESGKKIDLSDAGREIDKITQEVNSRPDQTPFTITLGGESYTFYDKRECLLALYEWKLHLAYIEPNMFAYYVLGSYTGIGITSIVLGYIGVRIGVRYTKDYLQQKANIINEGITRTDLDRMANSGGTGTLDKTIDMYRTAGFKDAEIKPLIDLQKKLLSVTIDAAKPDDVLRAQSSVYRYLARMRGRLGWFVSSFLPINKEIKLDEKPIRGVANIAIGSINKGPEGNFTGWQLQTQKESIMKYADGFGRFNGIIDNIDTILKNPPHNLSDIKRLEIRKAILNVYVDGEWPLKTRGFKVRIFRNRFDEVQKILDREGVVLGGNLEIFMRALKGEIEPTIKARISGIQSQIHAHPAISDANEKRLISELSQWRHVKSPGDFDINMNRILSGLSISGITSIADIERAGIKPEEIFSLEDISRIRTDCKTDLPNYAKIAKYLKDTTEGHKGIIFFNIAKIMNGESPIDTLPLDASRHLVSSESLDGITPNRVGEFIRNRKAEIINQISGFTRPPTSPAEGPSETIEKTRERARGFADRIILETAIHGKISLLEDEGIVRELHKRIRDSKTLDSSNFEGETLKILKDLVQERGGNISKIPNDIASIRPLSSIQADIQARGIAKGISAADQGELSKVHSSSVLRDFLKPGKLLKFLL